MTHTCLLGLELVRHQSAETGELTGSMPILHSGLCVHVPPYLVSNDGDTVEQHAHVALMHDCGNLQYCQSLLSLRNV